MVRFVERYDEVTHIDSCFLDVFAGAVLCTGPKSIGVSRGDDGGGDVLDGSRRTIRANTYKPPSLEIAQS